MNFIISEIKIEKLLAIASIRHNIILELNKKITQSTFIFI